MTSATFAFVNCETRREAQLWAGTVRLHLRFRTIRGVAYHIKVGICAKECADCLPGDRMIVNDENMCNPAHTRP